MTLTLKEAITATQTTVDVNGTDTLSNGDLYSIEDEQVYIVAASAGSVQPGQTAWQRLNVQRGQLGTTEASHAAGTAVTLVETPLGAGAGGGAIAVTTVLTNAQIKTLPTVYHELVPAPGPGLLLMPQLTILRFVIPVAYTGVDADAFFAVVYSDWYNDASVYSSPLLTQTYLDGGHAAHFWLLPGPSVRAEEAATAGSQTVYGLPQDSEEEVSVNSPLKLVMNNNADLTGGGAGNSLTVEVHYLVLDIA